MKAIVVGASSGIGREIARQLAATGWTVAAVARRLERLEELAAEHPGRVLPFCHDVTQVDEVPAAFQAACLQLEGLDLLVYAAGVMPVVAEHEFSTDKDLAIVQTNLIGAIAWCNQAAIRFQGVGAGTIVGIGSVAGDRGRRGQPAYHASKAALATYLESLRNRLATQGVKVVTVKPGPVATEMTAHLDLKKAMSAEAAAAKVIALAKRPGEHYLSPVHRAIFFVIRNLPSPIMRRLKL